MKCKFVFDDGSEAIAHYGVKGMKWGKRKAEPQEEADGTGGASTDEEGEAAEKPRLQVNPGTLKGEEQKKRLLAMLGL